MDLGLEGKRALVTGGIRGIGRATVLALVGAGVDVVVCYQQDEQAAGRLGDDLAATGRRYEIVRTDLRQEDEVTALAERCRCALGGLDILVNNAGVFGRSRFDELTAAEWRRVLDIDVTAYFLMIKAALPLLSDQASIVNLGAAAAQRGVPMSAHFTAAKAAVTGLGRSLSRELGGRGIRVNTLEPGILDDPADTDMPPQFRERLRRSLSLGRLPTPEDVAGTVLFLASELSRSVTGTTVTVDAGM